MGRRRLAAGPNPHCGCYASPGPGPEPELVTVPSPVYYDYGVALVNTLEDMGWCAAAGAARRFSLTAHHVMRTMHHVDGPAHCAPRADAHSASPRD
eukprot:7376772-Prymnesium_polylepis.1